MSNLGQRVITALIGGTLVIAAISYGELTFLLLLLLIAVLAVLEFYRHLEHDHVQPQKSVGTLITILPFVSPILNSSTGIGINLLPVILILPFIVFMRELWTKSEKPFTNIALTLLGPIYLALPLFLFYLLSFEGSGEKDYHPQNILGYLFILWASDTGAYFTGRFLGKHKLFERISPKKTWEGFFGGLALSVGVAYTVSQYYTSFTPATWLTMSVIIACTGALGDLVESLFKRSIQVKDSGSILPGHGGILDRFDALFISAPFVFVYLQLFN
ncbi:MAG: phosphatidate cytidylyltransferase [Bacteroidota bacterium]